MNVRQVDDAGNLWFLSASDSHTNEQVAATRRFSSTSRGRRTRTSCT